MKVLVIIIMIGGGMCDVLVWSVVNRIKKVGSTVMVW